MEYKMVVLVGHWLLGFTIHASDSAYIDSTEETFDI